MKGYQKTIIVGHLGRDPEMRYMPDGTAVTNFSVAVSRKWTDKHTGEPKEETTWFNVSAWNRLAEIVNQYAVKGTAVLVEGDSVTTRTYPRKDGTVASSLNLRAVSVQLLGSKDDAVSPIGHDGYEDDIPAIEEDDVPF